MQADAHRELADAFDRYAADIVFNLISMRAIHVGPESHGA